MIGKHMALGLTLSGALFALAGCGGGDDDNGNAPDPSQCTFRADGTADPNDRNCYCPDNSLVPQGGDCDCDTSDPDDPDCDFCDYPANQDHPDCSDTPQADPFRPAALFFGGVYTYDPENDEFRTFVANNGEVPPYITIDLWDARFETTENNAFRCGLLLVPREGVTAVPSRFHSYNVPSGALAGDHTSLMFSLRAGEFEVRDYPDDNAQGGRIPGCIEVQNDERRGFGSFSDGDIIAFAEFYEWSVGIGALTNDVRQRFEALPADNTLRQLVENGFVSGGSVRLEWETDEGEQRDIASPGQWSIAFQVDGDFVPVEGEGDSVRVPVSDMGFDGDQVRPSAGIYQQNAFYGFSFQG